MSGCIIRAPPVLAILLGLLPACAPGLGQTLARGEPVYRSQAAMPEWVSRRPDIPGHFVAVGIATQVPSIEAGQQAALQAASSEVVSHLGMDVEVQYNDLQTETVTRVVNEVTARGAARVASGRTLEMYHEEFVTGAGADVGYRFDVYVLVAIPRTALAAERKRVTEQLKARRDLLAALWREAVEAGRNADLEDAVTRWIRFSDAVHGDAQSPTLAAEASHELARLVDDVELLIENPSGSAPPNAVLVSARLRTVSGVKPLGALPLRFFFSRGSGAVVDRTRTDAAGVAKVPIRSVSTRRRPVVLSAAVDVGRLIAADGPLATPIASLRACPCVRSTCPAFRSRSMSTVASWK